MRQISLVPLLDKTLPYERAAPADEAIVRERLARALPKGVSDPVCRAVTKPSTGASASC